MNSIEKPDCIKKCFAYKYSITTFSFQLINFIQISIKPSNSLEHFCVLFIRINLDSASKNS